MELDPWCWLVDGDVEQARIRAMVRGKVGLQDRPGPGEGKSFCRYRIPQPLACPCSDPTCKGICAGRVWHGPDSEQFRLGPQRVSDKQIDGWR